MTTILSKEEAEEYVISERMASDHVVYIALCQPGDIVLDGFFGWNDGCGCTAVCDQQQNWKKNT